MDLHALMLEAIVQIASFQTVTFAESEARLWADKLDEMYLNHLELQKGWTDVNGWNSWDWRFKKMVSSKKVHGY